MKVGITIICVGVVLMLMGGIMDLVGSVQAQTNTAPSEVTIGGRRYAVSTVLTPLDGGLTVGPLAAPAHLALEKVTAESVSLVWQDVSVNETAFAVFRKDAGHDWARVGVTAPNTPVFTDLNLLPNIEYSYRVRAANNSAVSDWSPIVTAFPFAPVLAGGHEPRVTTAVDLLGNTVALATPGQTVVVVGENFGTTPGLVSYNTQPVPVVTWTDTRITIRLDGVTPNLSSSGLLLVRRPDGHYFLAMAFPVRMP